MNNPYGICPCCGERFLTLLEIARDLCGVCEDVLNWLIKDSKVSR